MSRPDWGKKRNCLHCGVRFYDLNRESAECPTCGTVNNFTADIKPARTAAAPKAKEKVPAPAAAADDDMADEDVDDDSEDLDDDVDDSLMEDASDLGVDDDDVSEVMEHVEDDSDDKG